MSILSVVEGFDWERHGLAGLVIATLFVVLVWVLKVGFRKIEKLDEEHRQERAEWKNEANSREDKLLAVVNELTIVVRELDATIKARAPKET